MKKSEEGTIQRLKSFSKVVALLGGWSYGGLITGMVVYCYFFSPYDLHINMNTFGEAPIEVFLVPITFFIMTVGVYFFFFEELEV